MNSTPAKEAYPLTPLQEGMLFHSVASTNSDVYVEQLCCTLQGELDLDAFRLAWQTLMQRHAVLRTGFAWHGLPVPLQVAGPQVRLPLEVMDWRGLPPERQAMQLDQIKISERMAGFSLSRPPLMRLKLIHLTDTDHRLLWMWHHIILDAWSVPMVFEEFFSIYNSHVHGRFDEELKPIRPFKEFIAWQQAQDLSKPLEFWRKKLDGFSEPTPLSIDRINLPDVTLENGPKSSGYELQFLAIPSSESDALKEAARRFRVTLNTLFQGAWSILLSRYSGREDVLFGTTVSGRPPEIPNVEEMVGLLINTLPVRVSVPGDAQLGPWLSDLQRQQAEIRQYEQTPLREIQKLAPIPGNSQLFESLVVFENFPLNSKPLSGGGLELVDCELVERSNLPLTVMMEVRAKSKLGVGYDSSRFDHESILRMMNHLRTVLVEMTTGPDRCLAALSILTGDERTSLLNNWSRGVLPVGVRTPAESMIHTLFERQVENSPTSTAAVFATGSGDLTWSYEELNRVANRLARWLRRLGVRAEDRVAICMEASLLRLASVLGVLKAGGAYVPLDPSYPAATLRDLIADCGASVVLVTPHGRTDLVGSASTQIIVVDDRERDVASGEDSGNLVGVVEPDRLAYLIYTSGSTGRPKGVAITHRMLRHLVDAQILAFRIDSQSRVLQFASLSFDASVSEIFTALLSGAALYMAPRQQLIPSRDLLNLMQRWGITTATFPPSVLSRLPETTLPSLKNVISAGEACTADIVAKWAPGRRFVNAYGPTEVTVCATFGELLPGQGKPTIGRALGDALVYILDPQLRPVPIGVTGEMYVGGPGVARGYWGRDDLTLESFLADPFSQVLGGRMYRTGDMARFLPSGEIDFLGRRDEQVKIRGFRIEPGEVESVIRQDAQVREATVVASGTDSNRHLVAYVVPESNPGELAGSPLQWWPSIAEYLVYDQLAYHAMISDERRNASYKSAMEKLVKDKIVLEVGTGPEALLSQFCVAAGARKVYAVELLQDSFERSRRRVLELGLQDRIEVIHGDATKVELPELAEVCVSEIVGAIGGCEGAAVIMNGVWRLLGKDARMIPASSTTMYAPVELPRELLEMRSFDPLPAQYVEKIFQDIGYAFDLRLCIRGLNHSHLLAEPQIFEHLDFTTPLNPEVRHRATHEIRRDGMIDGFLVWLTLDTGSDDRIDILKHEHCWLPVFLPAFDCGLPVRAGDRIEALTGAVLCEDGIHPDYFVEGALHCAGQQAVEFRHYSPHHAHSFRASPFYGTFFSDGEIPRTSFKSQPQSQAAFDVAALRQRLQERLPDHMIPSAFVLLDHLPHLASGKVDRSALPLPVAAKATTVDSTTVPLHGDVERAIAAIWQGLLQLDQVGLQTNFFDHGGHSLLLLGVQDQIESKFGIQVPVADLFACATVETLSRRISELLGTKSVPGSSPDVGPDRIAARRNAISKAAAKAKEKRVQTAGEES